MTTQATVQMHANPAITRLLCAEAYQVQGDHGLLHVGTHHAQGEHRLLPAMPAGPRGREETARRQNHATAQERTMSL